MPPTAGFAEKLIECDIEMLTNVPPYPPDTDLIVIKGASSAQISFASSVRAKKVEEWSADLPRNVSLALRGIADATWWLANQSNDSTRIKWPISWTMLKSPQGELAPLDPNGAATAKDKAQRVMGAPAAQTLKDEDVATFDRFARKACQSPELAYLAMMALLYRQTRNQQVLEKFNEARQNVGGHLAAIDRIVGS